MKNRKLKTFTWKCVCMDGSGQEGDELIPLEAKEVSVQAYSYYAAEKDICDYCNKNNLVPIQYIGWND